MDAGAACDHFEPRPGTHDGVTPLALARLDGFEEEGGRGARVGRDESAIRDDGRELIGEERGDKWDKERDAGGGGTLSVRQSHELIPREIGHGRRVWGGGGVTK